MGASPIQSTKIDLSANAYNKAGAIALLKQEHAQFQKFCENLKTCYTDCMGGVWQADGHKADAFTSQCKSALDNPDQSSNNFGSIIKDTVITGALTLVNPALGAGYALGSAVTAGLGGESGNSFDQYLKKIEGQFEERIKAAEAATGQEFTGKKGPEADSPSPLNEGYTKRAYTPTGFGALALNA